MSAQPDIIQRIICNLAVQNAFSKFRKDFVDLEPDKVEKARSSTDNLINSLVKLCDSDSTFPPLYYSFEAGVRYVHRFKYGSFARHTKIIPLDDIDLMPWLTGRNTTASRLANGKIVIRPFMQGAPLSPFVDELGNINSTKILNKIRDTLITVENYKKAETHKNKNAVTFQLQSYDWNFDIVPAIPFSVNALPPYSCYLIPDGEGYWMPTDPQIDHDRIVALDKKYNGLVTPTLRHIKFWNRRGGKPSLMPYYVESMASDIFEKKGISGIQEGIKTFFDYAGQVLVLPFPDPKGLGKNLDADVEMETKLAVGWSIAAARKAASEAFAHKDKCNAEDSIRSWQKIFGDDFK